MVNTKLGPIVGIHTPASPLLNAPLSQAVDSYLGIPFAQPPLGELRFRPPKPLENSWSEPLKAVSQPPKCVSLTGGQEDCLYLNVFVPSTASSQPRPVMVWIYGGGFNSGSIRVYDGKSFAATEDVVLVMGNYRVGVLGFLSSDWSMKESGTTGNWGLLDQRAVFRWVQENIAAFGGDPSRVTIFGESAGAMSIVSHLVSEPSAEGLFQSAIIQSGTTHVDMFFQPRKDADLFHEWFAKTHLNCPRGLEDYDCLRRVPATRFPIAMTERDGWGAPTWANPIFPIFTSAPVIDGKFLKDTPFNSIKQGKIMKGLKSIVIGTTQDEGSVFTTQLAFMVRPTISFPPTEPEMYRTFSYILGEGAAATSELLQDELPKYKQAYPEKPNQDFREADFQFVSNVIRNMMFACPTVTLSELTAKLGIPTFVYNFALGFWPEASLDFPIGQFLGKLDGMKVEHLGVFHSSDVPFVLKQFINRNITMNDISLETPYAIYMSPVFTKLGDKKHDVSDKMSCFWANTARCGTPTCSASCGVSWDQYDTNSRKFLSFEFDGSYATKQIRSSGDVIVREAFPTVDKCNWYLTVPVPFHDLKGDLKLSDPLKGRIDFDNGIGVCPTGLSLLIMVMLVSVL